jgi:hypothetical protein
MKFGEVFLRIIQNVHVADLEDCGILIVWLLGEVKVVITEEGVEIWMFVQPIWWRYSSPFINPRYWQPYQANWHISRW